MLNNLTRLEQKLKQKLRAKTGAKTHLPANRNLACRRLNTSVDTYRISASNQSKDSRIYYGSCEPKFKSRYNNHTYSFRHPHMSSATELSKFYWSSVDRGSHPTVKWSIKKKSTPYQMGRRRCNLCFDEKFIILTARKDENLLNKRSENIYLKARLHGFFF